MEIYKITDLTNNMVYVGQTTRTPKERFKEHMKADSLLSEVIREHGAGAICSVMKSYCA